MYYDSNKLKEVIANHDVYLKTGDRSKRAALRGADLSGANLRGAKLDNDDIEECANG